MASWLLSTCWTLLGSLRSSSRSRRSSSAPSDFRLHVLFHTDPQFYAFIANGYPGSAMAAWKEQLSPDDIWNLVNFLRSTFTEAPTQ